MKQGEKTTASTQNYLPFSEIKEGAVQMKNGSLRAVIIVSSFNFALKSEDEKNAVLMSFQEFLNSLSFPVQIVANSRKLDLSGYLANVEELGKKQQNPLLRVQVSEYIKFIDELLEYANIMEKRFYVVVPYYPFGISAETGLPNPFKKQQDVPVSSFDDNRKKLLERVEEVISSLSSVGLRCAALGTEDLLELYYSTYNPETSQNQKIKNAEDFNIEVTGSQGQAGGQVGTIQ